MSPTSIQKLKDFEGLRLKPYTDTVGKLTIGWGRNLDDIGISFDEATVLLDNDIGLSEALARMHFKWFDSLGPVRQDFITMMIFNIGVGGLKSFTHMLAAIEASNWTAAGEHLANSKWAGQVGPIRSGHMRYAIEHGAWSDATV